MNCGSNEEYLDCGPACPVICSTVNDTCHIHLRVCPTGCFCKEGYARRAPDNNCIPINQCP